MTYNVFDLTKEGKTSLCMLSKVLKTKKVETAIQVFFTEQYPNGHRMMVTQRPVFDNRGEVKYSIGIIRDMDKLTQDYQRSSQMAAVVAPPKLPGEEKRPVFCDPLWQHLLYEVERVAPSEANVLITGESGVGKEVLAEYIHAASRAEHEMVRINCASLPENLLEAELFGYAKGAFTGALAGGKKGLMELADKGTLFLDEINSIPLALQGKLLRAIETKMVRPVGSNESHRVDFRLITASNEDLPTLVREKRFRQDLYYRCNVICFEVPPLRERKGDIRPLCDFFLKEFGSRYGVEKRFSEGLYRTLEDYDWPGNVRELRNFIERAVLMTDYNVEVIDEMAPAYFQRDGSKEPGGKGQAGPAMQFGWIPGWSLRENVAKYERWIIEQAIRESGTLTKAAAALGIDKSTLIRKRAKGAED